MTERRLVNSSVNLKSKEIFKIINETIINNCFKNMIAYFCKVLDVLHSGYYNYLNTIDNQIEIEDKDLNSRDNILKAYNYIRKANLYLEGLKR